MTLRVVAWSAWKDLRRRATDPLALALWLGIPLLVGGLMALVAGGPGGAPRGLVLLADEDGGLAARFIQAGLTQGPLGSLFDVERVTAAEGRARIEAGGASALILVPAGATEAVLDQTPLQLTLVTNPAQRILPAIVQEALELMVEGTFYLQRLVGEPLRSFRAAQPGGDDFPASAQVAGLAGTINDRIRDLRLVAFPPVLEVVQQQTAGSAQPAGLDFGRLFLPGLLFMSLLFIAQGMSADVWEEQAQGTLRRAISAPPGILSFVVGKVVAGAVLVAAVALVGLAAAVALFDVTPGRALLAWPWCVFGGTVLVALFLAPQVAASSQRGANMLSTMVVFPLMMIGGSFFPFESMPDWMATVGRWTPNGQAVARLEEILDGRAMPVSLAIAAIVMLVPALASIAFTARRVGQGLGGAA